MDLNLEKEKNYNFNFIRKIDNVYVEEDGILINVNAVNGKINQYRLTWANKEIPSKDNIISLEKAYDVLFNKIKLELKYVDDVYDEKSKKKKEAILVYGLKDEKPSVIHYKDIENSYAKDKINILAQYGISLAGEEFKPKAKIIQKEFLYLLLKSKDPYYGIKNSEDDLYRQLINMGIIKEEEKSAERIVTKDISPELKGYVSIAYGLKIIQGYNGKLDPKAELKREDGANMIYNLLFKGN